MQDEYAAHIAPEICIEVLSPTNTKAEMDTKRALYFEAGAEEVWLCAVEGTHSFHDAEGERESSGHVPSFSLSVSL